MKRLSYLLAIAGLLLTNTSNAQIITTVAGSGGYGGVGTGGDSGDGGQATNAELREPFEITLDAVGNIYFSDAVNSRIRMINAVGIITTIAGNGTYGSTGDGGQATDAKVANPFGVTFDKSGNLYIADELNNRVRKISYDYITGINNMKITNNNEILIYPNPASTTVNIKLETQNKIQTANLQITDLLGNTVKQVKILNEELSMDVSDLNEGIYTLSITSKAGITNKKLMIVR